MISTTAIVINSLTIEHLDALASLFDAYRVFYEKGSDVTGAKEFLKQRMINNESVLFGAFAGNKLVAFTLLYPLFSSTRMKRLWLLNDLYVESDYRGNGIARLLLERVKDWCFETGACGFSLETAKANVIGNRLYQRVGLEIDDDHNYYCWSV